MGSKVFWAIVAGFLLGVCGRSFLPLGFAFIGFLTLLGAVALSLTFVEREKRQACIVIAVFLFAGACGIARMQFAVQEGDPYLTTMLGKHVVVEGVVSHEPDLRETSTLISVQTQSLVGTSSVRVQGGMLAILPPHTDVHYGDTVRVSGILKLPERFETGNGRQFDYPHYLAAQGIQYEIPFARVSDVGESRGNAIVARAYDLKERYVRGIQATLPEPEAGLAAGITVGDKRSVGPEISADFQRDSLVHMVVLSGYNITVVLNAVAYLLAGLPRVAGFSGAIAIVIFFGLVSGGASSALRAGIMALIAVVARMTHRIYLGERALALTAFLLVLYTPFTLVYDPSFQLSALATLGLILFTPIFAVWFSRLPERFGLREIVSSTCATQLMVLPLLLYQNGTFSVVALPANALALLPVPLAMFFSFVAALGGMLFGSYAVPLAYPAHLLLWYIIAIAHFFASLPFAAVSIPAFGAWWLFVAYAILFGGYGMLKRSGRPFGAAAKNP